MNPSRLKIALVSSSYHPHFGGVEEHVRHVAREAQGRGHAVEVWTVDRGDGLRDEVIQGCRVRYLPTPLPARSARALASGALRVPRALARWFGAYAAFRPDVINVQCFGPNGVYGLALATLTRTPLVVSSHGETFGDEHGAFDKSALLRASLRRAALSSTLTACSSLVADDLRSRFHAREVLVIPNGVDLHPASAPPSQLSSQASGPVLIGVGRLVPQKGFDLLLEAAAQSRYKPEVWIVGDGAELPRLKRLASTLDMRDRVHFLGRRSPAEVRILMASADAVVVPSRAEAFGMVVLEAWASSAPVLATGRGGPAEFVSDGRDGLLIDPQDISTITAGIDRVLGDEDLAARLVETGHDSVLRFSWDRVVDAYERLWVQLPPHGARSR